MIEIYSEHVLEALQAAINARRAEERQQGFTSDSAQVAAWETLRDQIETEFNPEWRYKLSNDSKVRIVAVPNTVKAWVVECRTGCTCCRSENHYRGYYATKEDAERRVAAWRQGINNPLASQYSRYGQYSVEEREIEVLPDGRCIDHYDDKVHPYDPVTVEEFRGNIVAGTEWEESTNEY